MTQPRRITAVVAAAAAAGLLAGACGSARLDARKPAAPVVLTSSQVAELRGYGGGDTSFGLGLLSLLCQGTPGANVALSPVSLATGLEMAYLGARGATAAAMARVLRLPAGGPGLASGLRARSALLASLDRPGVRFTVSNRIWADPSLITSPAFVAALRGDYQAGLTHVPLLSDPQQARERINAAVAADTGGHIRQLLPAAALAAPMGWVLTDALYLDAAWQHPFSRAMTSGGPFATGSRIVTARYLNGDGYATAAMGGWTAAELPYRGARLDMLALLPPAGPGGGGATGCRVPGAGTVAGLAARLASASTPSAIALPKISIGSSESLQQPLTTLGMGIAFGGGADFAGISPQAARLGFVRHAATLAVGEKGTIASAATAVGVAPSMAVARVLRFDRPYLLVLRDSLTGEPLMMAWVANPAAS